MLVVSPLRSKDETQIPGEGFKPSEDELPDFSDGGLLETIDFDDLFLGIDEGDVFPDLEMDPELLAGLSANGSGEDSDGNTNTSFSEGTLEDKLSGSGSGSILGLACVGDEIASKEEEAEEKVSGKDCEKGLKSSPVHSKNNPGKRKVKIDWTPELHRRFVQAVEQLGVDKAVPSRILEIMGIDCLTRHNIASHLQKYRSHRKHLLARETEAARWSHMRQAYAGAGPGGGGGKRSMSPWLAPTMGFPPVAPVHHHFRPLHVWGHPPMDQSMLHTWPKHLLPWPLSPSPASPDPAFWNHHRVCYPQPIPPPTRFAAAPVPGIPPGIGVPSGHAVLDFQPSKETIDAVIGDVITKPWLPLPLGLKPPSTDGVLVELQRQGVPKFPPSCY